MGSPFSKRDRRETAAAIAFGWYSFLRTKLIALGLVGFAVLLIYIVSHDRQQGIIPWLTEDISFGFISAKWIIVAAVACIVAIFA